LEFFLKDDGGRPLDARIEVSEGRVILYSRSGPSGNRPPTNTKYSQALRLILQRLNAPPEAIESVLIDSAPARLRPEEQRVLASRDDFLQRPLKEVRNQIVSKMRAFGRGPEMPPHEGNSNKRLRFDTSLNDGELRRRLRVIPAPATSVHLVANSSDGITRRVHVEEAFEQLRRDGVARKNWSKKWDVVDPLTGERFPPKEVLRVAKRLAGDTTPEPTGGAPTNERLRDLQFDVVLKKGIETSDEAKDITSVLDDETDETTKSRLVNARLGQGDFREALLDIWESKCILTECNYEPLLRASHIKPWRESTNRERLDPNNGLLLAAHVDVLFDRFLVSFSDDGTLLVSPLVPDGLLESLAVPRSKKVRLRAENYKYLKWHRKRFRSIAGV
jgi:hypothetical protein